MEVTIVDILKDESGDKISTILDGQSVGVPAVLHIGEIGEQMIESGWSIDSVVINPDEALIQL